MGLRMATTSSLSDKITKYLEDKGVFGAELEETTISIPLPNGEYRKLITGVITSEKLDAIADEFKAKLESAA